MPPPSTPPAGRILLPLIPAARLGSSAWLLHLRSFAVVGQLITVLFCQWVLAVELHYEMLFGLVAFTAATNGVYWVWLRRHDPRASRYKPEEDYTSEHDATTVAQSVALGLMLLDLLMLTAMLYWSGGANNPFSFFYFVNLAVGGVVIRPKAAWSLALIATIGYAFILSSFVAVPELATGGRMTPGTWSLHSTGLMLAFATCASVVTHFVTRTSGLLRARERQLRESQLAQAADRRLESLTTLAAGAAHELATPLSTIDVISRELSRHLEDVPKPESVDHDLRLIDHQLEMCRQILHRMRGAAGDSMAQQWYKTTVGDLIDATLEGVRDPHRVDVLDAAENVEQQTLWMPEEAVAQAIRNLIHNGLDASESSERVRLESRIVGTDVTFTVRDEGQGMSDEVLNRLGDPFFTTKEPGRGIGLGLFLTRNVISQLGGSIEFDSKPGQGTFATVTLPIANPANRI
ncbi:MAG: ATP-binding protein [Planctomycetota bacterium]